MVLQEYKSFETERLTLRPTNKEDAAFILKLLNSPKWLQFVGDRNVKNEEDSKNYIKDRIIPQLERLGFGNYTVIRKSDREKIGSCGLYDRQGVEGIDIGFAFLPEFEKMGYGFEAAKEVKRAAVEDFKLKTIRAITVKENIASQKLLEKLGLVFIEVIKIPGDEEDLLLYEWTLDPPREK